MFKHDCARIEFIVNGNPPRQQETLPMPLFPCLRSGFPAELFIAESKAPRRRTSLNLMQSATVI